MKTAQLSTPHIWVLAVFAAFLIPQAQSWADQPYIDHLKKDMEKPEYPELDPGISYTDSIKAKLKKEDDSVDYSKNIKSKLDAAEPEKKSDSYTEQEKARLGPGDQSSAIAAVKEGHSQLEYKKSGDIHGTLGLRFGVGLSRDIKAGSDVGTGRGFNDVYGSNYAPDLSVYYEAQPFHDASLKNLGIFAMGGVGIFKGLGTFATPPRDATSTTGNTFPPNSATTQFHFFEIPAVAGARYGFNVSKYFRPYAMGGPAFVGYLEQRNDNGPSYHGVSKGYFGCVGMSFLMDWFSQHDDWDRYAQSGIKHTYLTLEYSRLKSTNEGGLNFSVSGPTLGVTFEL